MNEKNVKHGKPNTSEQAQMRAAMLSRPIGSLLFEKAYPTVIIQLITVIYNTADTYFVAKVSTTASAAVGVVFSLMSIIQAVGFGIGMGSGSIISRRLGASDQKSANTAGSSAMFAGILAGILIAVLGLLNIYPLMRMIGASETVLPDAVGYGTYILLAAPFMCMAFIFNNVLRSEGQTFLAMIGMTAGGILNLFLDPLFIFPLGMGASGAAVATAISQIFSVLIMGSIFVRGKSIVRLRPQYISKSPALYLLILKTGLPTICRQGLGSLSSAILNVQAMAYGDAAVAAISIANKVYMLVRNIILGIGQGYQPIAGYCYGAGKRKRVRELFRIASIAGTVICVGFAILIFAERAPLMGWFRDDAEVISIGSHMLMYLCMALPFMGYSTYVNQTYQCLGFSTGATFLACCRQGICFIPLALVLPRLFGLNGIEMLQAGADILTFIIAVPFQIHFFRKHLSEDTAA